MTGRKTNISYSLCMWSLLWIVKSHSFIAGKVHSLTHWGRDNMAAIFKTTFSDAFTWMKIYELRLIFHWALFLRFQLAIFQHWFRQWLGAGQATSHYLNQWWLVYWRIYASLGLNELTLTQVCLWLLIYLRVTTTCKFIKINNSGIAVKMLNFCWIDDLVLNLSISSALALEILQSCTNIYLVTFPCNNVSMEPV